MDTPKNSSNKLLYLLEVNKSVNNNIKLADQKSLVFVALNSSLFGALHSSKYFVLDTNTPLVMAHSLITFTLLAVAILFALAVIFPRGLKQQTTVSRGNIATPSKISLNKTEKEFINEINESQTETLIENLSSTAYSGSVINNIKYKHLLKCILFSIVSWVLSFSLVVVMTGKV